MTMCCWDVFPAAHRRHGEGLAEFSECVGLARLRVHTVRAAASLAGDMGVRRNTILECTLTRGQFIFRRFGRPAVTLGVLTDKLPNTSGLARGQIDRDLKDDRAIQKAQDPVSAAGTAPQGGATRRRRPRAWHPRCLRPPPPRSGRWVLFAAGTARRLRSANGGGMARWCSSHEAGRAPAAFGGGGPQEEKERKRKRERRRRRQCSASAAVQPRFVTNRQV